MDGNRETTSYQTEQTQIPEAWLNCNVDRSFKHLKGVKKAFFRLVDKIIPTFIVRLLQPIDTEQVKKGLKDRGIQIADQRMIRAIADTLQTKVCISMREVIRIMGTCPTLSPLSSTVVSCKLSGITCEYNLPRSPRGFTPIFYNRNMNENPPIATVNAGAHDGHIGGGGINEAFAAVAPFAGSAHHREAFKRDLNRHLSQQAAGESHITTIDLRQSRYGMNSLTLYKSEGIHGHHAGSVGVYEYLESPYDNPANQAMVYVIPPKRSDYETDQAFLTAVRQTAENMIAVYNHYASQQRQLGRIIPALRLCAFSAGSYAGNVPSRAVTKAILEGIETKCQMLSQNGYLNIENMKFSSAFDYALAHYATDPNYLKPAVPIKIEATMPDDDREFLAFFNGTGQIHGHTRQKICNYSFSRLEGLHNDLRAVFPNTAGGMPPFLSTTLFRVLNADENHKALKKYIEDMLVHTMLPFWGIRHESLHTDLTELDFSQCEFSIENIQQSKVWRTKNTGNNHLRITQVIHFLVAVGYQDYAQKLCQFMQEKRREMRLPPIVLWNIAANFSSETDT